MNGTKGFSIQEYHKALCPDYPAFLDDYITLPIVKRLGGVGLLCGTDWTPLFKNSFFYTRLDHSIGVALIIWNFTKDKKQTLAGLLHDVATPAFSHVMDFKNGDALTQSSTEAPTRRMINEDIDLSEKLFNDGLYKYEVDDYHIYPIADNDIPGLSADRLEYMYPSAAALDGSWTLEDAVRNYSHIKVLKNESGKPELGFDSEESALEYTQKFCGIGMLLQHNEDKVAMQLMADIIQRASECAFIYEPSLYAMDEAYIISCFDQIAEKNIDAKFTRLYKTFRTMTAVEHRDTPLAKGFNVSLNVKKRYVNPLVQTASGCKRIADINESARKCIDGFLAFEDTPFGSVPWAT